jgi:4-amino-4-deoxy-L-arabinose transferase-like glycosyltransferase
VAGEGGSDSKLATTRRGSYPGRALAGVVALGAVVRALALLELSGQPFFTHYRLDALLYHESARRVAAGDWLLGSDVLHMSPLYTWFLGGLYALFGDGPWAPRVAQIVLGLVLVALIFDLARRVLGRRWAVVGGLVAALYGPAVFYEQALVAATLAGVTLTASLWAAVRASQRPGPGALGRWGLAGLFWGLSCVVRPNALLVGAPLGVAAWLVERAGGRRRGAVAAAVVVAAGLAAIAPVTLRNVVVAGEPVLVTDSAGLNFYLGNGPGANGTFRIPSLLPGAVNAEKQFEAFRDYAEVATGRELSSREVDSFWVAETLAHMRDHPGLAARVFLEKAWLFWHARELANTYSYAFGREIMASLHLAPVSFGWITGLALLGLVVALVRRDAAGRLVASYAVCGMVALVLFFVLAHYRLVFVGALIPLAVVGLKTLADTVRAHRWSRALAAVSLVAAATSAAHVPRFEPDLSDEYRRLGYAYHVRGDLSQAEASYLRALEADGENRSAHKNLGILYAQRGDVARAQVHFSWVLVLAERVGDDEAAAQAGAALDELGVGRLPVGRSTD